MAKTKNPAAGKRQGFDIAVVRDKSTHTAAYLDLQPNLDVVALIAARSGVSPISVRAQLDAFGMGDARG